MTGKETWAFNTPEYRRITWARIDHLRRLLRDLSPLTKQGSALDAGCGVGYFARFLAGQGFDVTGFDGREEIVQEARRRHPDISFHVLDIEDKAVRTLGEFDVVICFGLLYHLENPFAALRNLRALASKILLIETRVAPDPSPSALLVEEVRSHDQARDYIALIPPEAAF